MEGERKKEKGTCLSSCLSLSLPLWSYYWLSRQGPWRQDLSTLSAGIRGGFLAMQWATPGTLELAGFQVPGANELWSLQLWPETRPLQAVCPLLGLAATSFLWTDEPRDKDAGSSLFLSLRLVLAFKAFACDIQSLGRKLASICLEHKGPVAPRSDSWAV